MMTNSTPRPFSNLSIDWLMNIYEDLKNSEERYYISMFAEAVAELSLRGVFTDEAPQENYED